MEQQQDHGGGDGGDREIDVEAPSPRRPFGKCAAEDGPQDAGEAVHRVDEAREYGPEPRADGDAKDRVPACCDPGGARAEDGAAEDEDCAVRCEACGEDSRSTTQYEG